MLVPLLLATLGFAQDDAETRIATARARIAESDYVGARLVLAPVTETEGPEQVLAITLTGAAWELQEFPGLALDHYERALTGWPEHELHEDLVFRKAEALATLGAPRTALSLVKPLDLDNLDEGLSTKVQLCEGIWRVQGQMPKRGLKLIDAALAEAPPDVQPFYQAKARATRAGMAVQLARDVSLDVPEQKLSQQMNTRGALVAEIEGELQAIVALEQPEWILEGSLLLAQSYTDFAQALVDAPVPAAVAGDAELEATYRAEVRQKANNAWLKSRQLLDMALDMALRLRWRSRRVIQLEDALEDVNNRLSA